MTEQFFSAVITCPMVTVIYGNLIFYGPMVVSDLLIATAYFFDSRCTRYLYEKSAMILAITMCFLLFSLFILFCGITHLFGIWTIWQGVYGYHGMAKAVTAVVSMTTAFYLYKLLPELLKVPTISQYEGIKSEYGYSPPRKTKN